MRQERKLLQARIEHLESIVCSVDYELNAKLAKLATPLELPPASVAVPFAAAATAEEGIAFAATANDAVALSPTMTVSGRARPAVNAQAELVIGSHLANRYRVDRLLGRGGMGAVYLAHDEVLEELVALKVMSSTWAADERAMVERFRREAAAARRVSSPNVIRIHDLGEAAGGLLYLSMEYFPGKTLAQMITSRGTLDSPEGRDIFRQICDGLAAAHEVGVVHRDLKPDNVLVGERHAVKLIDFGLAKAQYMSAMTGTGLILGTPQYMSPEQVRGGEIDARSDLYSLGAMTYHAMTGRPPFVGSTPIAVGFAHCTEIPEPPRSVRANLSQRLNDVILQALAKSPSDRPQSVREFRNALLD